MAGKVLIVISCGTNQPNRATRAIHLATVAHQQGNETVMFFLDEAVYLVKEGLIEHLRAATGDVADDLMTYLQAHEVPLLACTPCAKARMISEDELIEGARFASAAELFQEGEGATVISL